MIEKEIDLNTFFGRSTPRRYAKSEYIPTFIARDTDLWKDLESGAPQKAPIITIGKASIEPAWPWPSVNQYPPKKEVPADAPVINDLTEEQEQSIRDLGEALFRRIDKTPPPVAKSVAVKKDAGKTDWSLVPIDAVEEIAKVLEFGAQKYSPHNWKEGGGFEWLRVCNSLLRHIFAWMRGEDNDPESGLNHLAHAGCNIFFLLHYIKNKNKYGKDNRV